MEMAKVTSKGQITIPVSIRRRLSIREGDKLLFIDGPDGVVMVNPDMLQSGQRADAQGKAPITSMADDVSEPEAEVAAPAEPEPAPMPKHEASPKPDVGVEHAPPPVPKPTPKRPAYEDDAAAAAAMSEVSRAAREKSLDLGALLDEIRNIGSRV
jgi:AbrB family looped-hinge helix DNA binding protein